jgi:shikimate dehydrogenase
LIGENTDVAGFLADLYQIFPDDIQEMHALILGAGGAARGVAHALKSSGWQVHVAARRLSQAQEIAFERACLLEENVLSRLLSVYQISLIVNTTPLGMGENQAISPWPNTLAFPEKAIIYDLVYNPAETILLKSARLEGLVSRNGLGMLVEQAALSFEIWTGQKPSLSALWQAIQ